MYKLIVKTHFDAAHYIADYKGKCNREHGHRWNIDVMLVQESLNDLNMVIDFKEVKNRLYNIIVNYLDHYQLNEKLNESNLTAEYLAAWLYNEIKLRISIVKSVTVWESPDCGVEYSE